MFTATYEFKFSYLHRGSGSLFPGLVIRVRNDSTGVQTSDLKAELDSGAEYSLFDGSLAQLIGLDLFDSEPFVFRLASGMAFESRVLPVIVSHRELGDFSLRARFSTASIPTNILGRDFFDLVRIGFDEHRSEVYLSALRGK